MHSLCAAIVLVTPAQTAPAQGATLDAKLIGRGKEISGDTPFPVGSLTKSLTALLVRHEIESGRLEVNAPVQRDLPWFRVADADASARITLRHLLNQTSDFSRADGVTPILRPPQADIEELARSLKAVSLNRPVGERAALQSATGRIWSELVRERVFKPLAVTRSSTDHETARARGMTAVHRIWFGVPERHEQTLAAPLIVAPRALGLDAATLAQFAPDLALAGAVSAVLLFAPGVF